MRHPTKRAVSLGDKTMAPLGATFVVVLGFSAQMTYAGPPAATAARLLNSGFINHGNVKLRPNAPPAPVPTNITVDTTLNPMTSGVITPAGSVYTIGTNYGVTAGNNEFFSFSTFNVGTGDTAQFMAASNIQNIISRVTGGTTTNIDGTIIAPGNFWFINPTGIIVTRNAVFDVSGSLALGAADFVNFTNGNSVDKFYADPAQPLTLSIGSPTSFGFLPTPASGALTILASTLGSTAAGSVTLASGGPLSVQGTSILSGPAGNPGNSGNITIQSLSSIDVSDATINSSGPANSSGVNSANGGLINIQGSSIAIDSSTLSASFNAGSDIGHGVGQGAILIQATGSASASGPDLSSSAAQPGELRVTGSTISTDARSGQNGNAPFPLPGVNWGDIVISADDVIFNTTSAHAIASGEGNSGNITLTGNLGTWLTGSSIADTEGGLSGAGVIKLNGGALGTSLVNTSLNAQNGNTQGRPSVDAVTISANGGPVNLQTATITTSNVTVPEPEGGFGFSSPANGIAISGQTIGIHASTLTSQTVNAADAGNIALTASGAGTNAIQIDGATTISSDATQGVTGIATGTVISIPNAGTIAVHALSGGVSIAGGSSLSSSAGPDAGQAGVISVTGTQLDLSHASILTTAASTAPNSVQSDGGSNIVMAPWVPGSVVLSASTGGVSISGNSTINTETTGVIDAGSVTISAPTTALVNISASQILSNSTGNTGNGGQISISGGGILIAQQSLLSSNYSNAGGNPGAPGSVAVFATGASSTNDPLAANLTAATPGVVRIVDSAITATNTGGTGVNNSVAGLGQISIGADLSGGSGAVSNNVVIGGSVLSTDVSAGGTGNNLTVAASNSVWIGPSPTGGYPLFASFNAQGVNDVRTSPAQSLITSQTETSAVSGGQVLIQGGSGGVTIANTFVDANNAVDGNNAGAIRVQSNIDINVGSSSGPVQVSNSAITTEASGVDLAGNIEITGGTVRISSGLVSAATTGTANAGNIAISATGADPSGGAALQVTGGAQINSDAGQDQGAASAGTVTLTAQNGTAQVGASTDSLSAPNVISTSAGANAGQAGVISIGAQNISLTDTQLLTTVATPNRADSNNVTYVPASVTLTASGPINFSDTLIDTRTSGAVDAGLVAVNGGSVSIVGGQQPAAVVLTGGTSIPESNFAAFSVTTSAGNAGEISINAPNGAVTIKGSADSGSGLIGTSYGSGTAATIRVIANSVTTGVPGQTGNPITSKGVLIESAAQGTGDGGDVTISAPGAINLYGTFITSEALPIGVAGANAGNVAISGGTVGIAGSTVTTQTSGIGIAGSIGVTAATDLSIIGSAISTQSGQSPNSNATPATGSAGPINLAGGTSVTLSDAVVTSSYDGTGATTPAVGFPGTITINAPGINILAGSIVSTTATDTAAISPGQIGIGYPAGTGFPTGPAPASVVIDDSTITATRSNANAGNGLSSITVYGNSVAISNGSLLNASATLDSSDAGFVFVEALNNLLIDNSALRSTYDGTGAANAATGSAGNVWVSAATITLQNGTILTSNATNTSGVAGQLIVGALPPSQSSVVVPLAQTISLDNTALSTTSTNAATAPGLNNSGGISVNGASVGITNGSSIDSSALGLSGTAGIIELVGQNSIAVSGSSISSSFQGPTQSGNAQGSAGLIVLSAPLIRITDGSALSTGATFTTGNAGDISITATGPDSQGAAALQIAGGSKVSSDASNGVNGASKAGTVTLVAPTGSAQIGSPSDTNQSVISSSAGAGAGAAGSVDIVAAHGIALGNASLSTAAGGTASSLSAAAPATITLSAGDGPLSVTDSTLNASTSGTQKGGEIDLAGSQVTIGNTKILAATTGTANAGNINIIASGADAAGGDALQLTGGSTLSSDASGTNATGGAGTVTLTATTGSLQVGLPADTTQTQISSSTGASAGGAGRVSLTAANAIALANASLSTIAGGTASSLSAATPATITLSANNGNGPLSVADSTLNATTTGAQAAGQIALLGSHISIGNTDILSSTTSAAPAGNIDITGSTVSILGGTGGGDKTGNSIAVSTTGLGNAGNIVIAASGSDPQGGSALQIDRMNVGSTASQASGAAGGAGTVGNAGTISLNASNGSVSLGDATAGAAVTQIQTSADASAGQAGSIRIGSAGSLTAQDTTVDTSVATTLLSDAHGTAFVPGTISVSAPAAVTLTGSTLNATTSGNVAAGDIQVTAGGTLQISSPTSSARSGVTTSSESTASAAGAAGKITLSGTSIAIDNSDIAATINGGNATTASADITLGTSGTVAVSNGATVKADTSGGAAGGAIALGTTADPISSLTVNGGSMISVDSSGSGAGAGHGGTLSVVAAGPVVLAGAGTALSSNSSNDAVGGSVEIAASSLSMSSGAQVTANTSSSGIASTVGSSGGARAARVKAPGSPAPVVTGGNVLVQTTGDVALTGAGTTISANATGAGSGGTVTIDSAGLSLTNGASIATTATGAGNSGAIAVTLTPPTPGVPPPLVLAGNSSITTNSNSSTGGNITVDAGGSPLNMNGSTIIATAGQQGNGGNITIDNVGRTILQASAILAEADSGNGGAIDIFLAKGALFVEDSQSLVSAQSAAGNNGTVTINSPQTNFNSALATPEVSAARTPELASNACRRDQNRSTFVREGRGGVAQSPDDYQTEPAQGNAAAVADGASAPDSKSASKPARTLIAAAQPGCN